MAAPRSPEPKQRGGGAWGGGRGHRPSPLSWLLLCLLSVGPAAASLPGLEHDYAVSPKFVCTPIPPEADPSCYSPPLPHGGGGAGHGGGGHSAGGHGGAGHNGSSRRAVMSEEAKATILHLRESLVRQKEVILDQRETIRELTAKLTLCEGFGGHQGIGHHDNGRHDNGHHNEHNDRRGGHHGPHRDHYYPHGGHHPDPHHPDPHHPDPHHREPHHPDPHHHPHHPPRKSPSHSKPSSFSADQTAKTLQTLKERLENLQARNSSSSYSSSLRDLLQRKINALEEQLHNHYRGHHNDHHGNARHDDHHDDHHGTGHHDDHPDDHHDDRHDNRHSNGRHDDPHDDHRGKGRHDDHPDEHHSPGHKDDHHDDHLNTGHNDNHRDDHHNSHRTNQHNNHRYPPRSSHSPRPYDHHNVRHYGRSQGRPSNHRDDHHPIHRGPGHHDNHRSGGSGNHHGDHHVSGPHDDHHVSGHHDDHHVSGHHDDHHVSGHHDDHHVSGHHDDHHVSGRHDDHHVSGHHDDHHVSGHHDDHHDSGHHDDHHGSGHHDDHHGSGHHDDHHVSGHHEDHHGSGPHDDHQEVPRHRKKHPPVRLHYPSTPPAVPHGGGAHGKLDTVLSHLHHRTPETAVTHTKTPQDPDVFQISFPLRTGYMHARMKGAVLKEVFALTVCLWLRGGAGGPGLGTPFSYSVPGQANELVLIEWGSNPMELLINDKAVTLPMMLTDRKWHHVCVAWSTRDGLWEAYLDGLKKGSGENLSAWHPVRAGGVFILGQEQDSLGGRFDASQSFVGDMADLQFWSRVLAPAEVHSQASCGAHLVGDVLSWGEASVELHGGVTAHPFLPCH
ncbi:sarcoplasmic reticulum histidine-rich calcium-binding protein-like [Gadus morhua]|uniref:sarcoplasmic reticulum histidine-rich calcium-binding protein-like n=1 Tax=Gadus morhua TaxID=8049 RepID=UPI0011B49218|nr:sarcoplasmic reticulum histidine-rich calcium-binding protein-like [Gadus morhua]